jgi:hypothetical protein
VKGTTTIFFNEFDEINRLWIASAVLCSMIYLANEHTFVTGVESVTMNISTKAVIMRKRATNRERDIVILARNVATDGWCCGLVDNPWRESGKGSERHRTHALSLGVFKTVCISACHYMLCDCLQSINRPASRVCVTDSAFSCCMQGTTQPTRAVGKVSEISDRSMRFAHAISKVAYSLGVRQ